MFHERGFNSSATWGVWDEHPEAVFAVPPAPITEFVSMPTKK